MIWIRQAEGLAVTVTVSRQLTDSEEIMKNKKAILAVLLAFALCAAILSLTLLRGKEKPMNKYSGTFFGTFDTVVSLVGYAPDEAAFQKELKAVEDIFTRLHRIFDNYHLYEGVNNLCLLNRDAAKAPVKVDEEMFELLSRLKNTQRAFGSGEVNVAMGSVLSLWHDAREAAQANPENARLPEDAALKAAATHTDIENLILNEAARTVYFADPDMKLDLGCAAKGYAAEKAAEYLDQSSMKSYIISAGGNVRAGIPPQDGRSAWGVGVQDPDNPSALIDTLFVSDTSVVTSGDYQRAFTVNGASYHHIVSPKTLAPAGDFRSVTVVTKDSAWADYLSTRLFLMSYEDGLAFLNELKTLDAWDGAEALWVLPDMSVRMTDGMKKLAKSAGAS